MLNDITDQKRAEQELRYLANYDTLTDLPNRALLSERLGRAIVRARRQDTRIAVLFLDLDRFKDINDSLGHAAGDRPAQAAATRLQATVGAADTVARLGGDEFTVVLEDVDIPTGGRRVAREILTAFEVPLEVDDRRDVSISPSIGISLYPDHAQVPTELLKYADTAMYQAKADGRNTYQRYNETMDAAVAAGAPPCRIPAQGAGPRRIPAGVPAALGPGGGRIIGVEALLRWHSAELGEIPPTEFIPLAEETGLILQIGDWVLQRGLPTLRRWQRERPGRTRIGGQRLGAAAAARRPARASCHAAEETGRAPERDRAGVTEIVMMANAQQTADELRRVRELGVTLAIDDFGTGYSSLAYLKRLPIDTLKIDKEFVGDLTKDPTTRRSPRR